MIRKSKYSHPLRQPLRVLFSFCALSLLLMVLKLPQANAIEVEGLYSSSVLVASIGNEREEQTAFSTGMREVLLKVSGSNETLNANSIRQAINNPKDYVESFAYHSVQISEGLDEEIIINPEDSSSEATVETEQIRLDIAFYESEILALLKNNNLPFWTSSRPETLLWVVIQEELGGREMLSPENDASNEIMLLLNEQAKARGLPLVLPLMDLQDQITLKADDAWSLDTEAIITASERYDAESILVLRMYRSLSGELLGKAVYLFRDRVEEYDAFEEDLNTFVSNGVNLATENLSAYFSIRLTDDNSNFTVTLLIDNIATAQSYANVITYVENLADINSYEILSVHEKTLSLKLSTGGQFRQLIETISLEDNLESVSDLTRDAAGANMHYRWVEQ